MIHMETIGVRELRQHASRWLARVRAGETFVITDRGRPVASLSPLHEGAGYERLVAEGKIAPGTQRDLNEIVDELDAEVPPDSGISVTEALLDLRNDER